MPGSWTDLLTPSAQGGTGRNSAIAQLLMQQSMDNTPIQSPVQGLAKLAQAYVAKGLMEKDQAQQTAGNASLAQALAPEKIETTGGGPSSPIPIGGGQSIDYAPPEISRDVNGDKRAQLAALLNGGAITPQSLAPQAMESIGLGAPKAPIKGSPGDVFYDASTRAPIPGMSVPVKPDKPEATPDIMQIAASLFPGDPKAQKDYIIKNSPANLKSITNINTGEFGRGMQGKAYAKLAEGIKDPSIVNTPEYVTAYQILSNPSVDPQTGTVVIPDLSAFPKPGNLGQQSNGQPTTGGNSGQRMPTIQGFAPPNPSQPEAQSAGFANRLATSGDIIDQNQAVGTSLKQRMEASIPVVGNYMVSPEYQKLDQAERNFVNAQLRRESGAVISEEEFTNAKKQYFPQPGDSPQVLEQKKQARQMAIRNMQLSAGNVLLPPGAMQQASPDKGAPVMPMGQGFGADAGSGGQQKTVVRTGTDKTTGKKVIQYSDGSVSYAP